VNLWRFVSRSFRPGFRRSGHAIAKLSNAYEALFTGHGSKEDAEIVLADIANWTGFYRVNGPGLSAEDRAFFDGQRAVYGRIFRFLRMTEDERRQLEEAARAEALVDAEEGQI
jgi:hypothetical protein